MHRPAPVRRSTWLPSSSSSSRTRSSFMCLTKAPAAPQYRTFDEAGVRGVDVGFWYAMLGPAGLSQEVVMRLNGEIANILALADVSTNLRNQGLEPVTSTPAQLAQ